VASSGFYCLSGTGSVIKRGLSVNQAIAGKKCMGTARPGKSSGLGTSRGKVAAMGMMMLAKDGYRHLKSRQ